MKLSLQEVWEQVGEDYKKGLINSESCLQAVLYKVLREKAESMGNAKVFVEPVIDYHESGSPKLKPDLLLCEDNKIKAIFELKFAPSWYPDVRGDLDKYKNLLNENTNHSPYYAERIPNTGGWCDPVLNLSDDTVFILTVIGQHDSESVSFDKIKPLLNNDKLHQNLCLMAGKVYDESKVPEFTVEGPKWEITLGESC